MMPDKTVLPEFLHTLWLHEDYRELLARFNGKMPPHALLLHGKEGVGKALLAETLVAGILCRHLDQGQPCGHCQSCRWLASGFHPDYCEIKGEAEIKVDEIRSIQDFSRLTAETGKKVVVIKHADCMNINAANSLLKVLEEPPANFCFILESSRIEKLPITVRSRCQSYFVQPPSIDEALHYMQQVVKEQNLEVSSDVLRLLLAISFDSPLKALSYLEAGYLEKRGGLLQTIYDLWSGELSHVKGVATLLESESLAFSYLFFLLVTSFDPDKAAQFKNLTTIFALLAQIPEQKRLVQYEKLVEIDRLRTTQTRTDWALEAWFIEFLG